MHFIFHCVQVEQQWTDLRQDIQALLKAPLVIDQQITPEDLVWASDVVTSRSFAGAKRLGQLLPQPLRHFSLRPQLDPALALPWFWPCPLPTSPALNLVLLLT